MSKSALPQSKPIAPPDSTRSRGEIREALRESENRYRVLIEGLGEGILYCDRNDTIIQVNSRMAELSGHSIEAMLGKRACELLVAEQHRELFRAKTAQRLQGVTESYELQFVRKDGSLFWATISATPIRNAGGEIVGTLGAITDVTKRKEAELALEAQREFLKLVIDTNPSLIFARDRAGRFTLANKATAEVYGSTPAELIGKTDDEFNFSAAEVARFRRENEEVFATGREKFLAEVSTTHAVTGEERWFQVIKRPLHGPRGEIDQLLGVATDITERKIAAEETVALQKQLMHSQKMEAIGQLAAGVAHDLNNAIAAVVGHLELVKMHSTADSLSHQSAATALGGCERATSLIRQLLGFSRQGKYRLKPLSLPKLVNETLEFLTKVIGKDISVRESASDDESTIRADPGQVQQALTNLIINAKHAMPSGGSITFSYENRFVPNPQRFNPEAQSGPFVVLRIEDTGIGIDSSNLDKIFEPFFSTRTNGEGSGLGLSMVYGTMQSHKGWILVDSILGEGTAFELFFPAESEPTTQQVDSQVARTNIQCSGHVLVIDDEPTLTELSQQFFAQAGVDVTCFNSPSQAVSWFETNHKQVDLILLDMKMPDMDGEQCFAKLKGIDPNAQVLLLSGYIQDKATQQLLEKGAVEFFQKPIMFSELVDWIVRRLEGGEETRLVP